MLNSQTSVLRFAEELSGLLQLHFPIQDANDLTATIEFNSTFIWKQRDELAPLLFIEFSGCKECLITPELARTIVSRVQKRIYRGIRKRESSVHDLELADRRGSESEQIQIFREIKAILPVEDYVLFQMKFIDGISAVEICNRLGLKKTSLYERLRCIEECLDTLL